MKYQRIFTIVIDSMGIGAMPNAAEYGDEGCDTLGHIDLNMPEFKIPHMAELGITRLHPLTHVKEKGEPKGYYGRLFEASVGKDTMTGHWEMMGLYITQPFQTFTDTGFPQELLDELSRRTGHKIIGNKAASGTEILKELGEQSVRTGDMIVYTSADSVLQICGNEETFGLEELYRCCEIARELTMKDEWKVGRVIARPFVGRTKDEFKRTSNRHDYALKPYGRTVLNAMKDAGLDVISVGKIRDIFDGEGITQAYKSKSSVHGMEQTIDLLQENFHGLCFTNLVDYDMLYGHRNDVDGYAKALTYFDERLPELLAALREEDILMITADHGCDPSTPSTDHSREYTPLVIAGPGIRPGVNLGTRSSFADTAATILDYLGAKGDIAGTSFLGQILGQC